VRHRSDPAHSRNRSGDRTLVLPSGYIEVVIQRK
jgi:hypothetical protein